MPIWIYFRVLSSQARRCSLRIQAYLPNRAHTLAACVFQIVARGLAVAIAVTDLAVNWRLRGWACSARLVRALEIHPVSGPAIRRAAALRPVHASAAAPRAVDCPADLPAEVRSAGPAWRAGFRAARSASTSRPCPASQSRLSSSIPRSIPTRGPRRAPCRCSSAAPLSRSRER
jgi:hypothetical protein